MIDLAVVTFTEGNRPISLKACVESVKNDLPDGAVHFVINALGLQEFAKQRLDALKLAKYVCFVDDDDIVVNRGITNCYNALLSTDAGIAFTDEALVSEDGVILHERIGRRKYEDLNERPFMIHHLTMLNTKKITDDLSFTYGYSKGVHHNIIRAAVKNGGAIHIPQIGYHWTQSSICLTKIKRIQSIPLVLSLKCTGLIPIFNK